MIRAVLSIRSHWGWGDHGEILSGHCHDPQVNSFPWNDYLHPFCHEMFIWFLAQVMAVYKWFSDKMMLTIFSFNNLLNYANFHSNFWYFFFFSPNKSNAWCLVKVGSPWLDCINLVPYCFKHYWELPTTLYWESLPSEANNYCRRTIWRIIIIQSLFSILLNFRDTCLSCVLARLTCASHFCIETIL